MITPSGPRTGALVVAMLSGLALYTPRLDAQATVTGYVREDSTLRGMSGVEVVAAGTDRSTRTDGEGRFVLRGVPPGSQTIVARAVGFEPAAFSLTAAEGGSYAHVFYLTRAIVRLDTVSTTAARKAAFDLGRAGFEYRRQLGFGKFVTPDELRQSEHRGVADMLATIQGIRIYTPPPPNHRARVAVNGRRTGLCPLRIYLDGAMVFPGGPNNDPRYDTRPDLTRLATSELHAIEVYRGASEVPGEYGGASAACGVLLIWTRRGG